MGVNQSQRLRAANSARVEEEAVSAGTLPQQLLTFAPKYLVRALGGVGK